VGVAMGLSDKGPFLVRVKLRPPASSSSLYGSIFTEGMHTPEQEALVKEAFEVSASDADW
jgi:hypothetical protein